MFNPQEIIYYIKHTKISGPKYFIFSQRLKKGLSKSPVYLKI